MEMLICTIWTGTACVTPSFGELFGSKTTEAGIMEWNCAHPYIHCSAYISYWTAPFHPFLSLQPCSDGTSLEFPTFVSSTEVGGVGVVYSTCTSAIPSAHKRASARLEKVSRLWCIGGSSPSAVEVPPPPTASYRALIEDQVLRCQEHFWLYSKIFVFESI
jgi:hypothetical protein